MRIGSRIRYLVTAEENEHYRRNWDPSWGKFWMPKYGATGIVVGFPRPGVMGASCQVRWDADGRTTWLGSMERFEVLS